MVRRDYICSNGVLNAKVNVLESEKDGSYGIVFRY